MPAVPGLWAPTHLSVPPTAPPGTGSHHATARRPRDPGARNHQLTVRRARRPVSTSLLICTPLVRSPVRTQRRPCRSPVFKASARKRCCAPPRSTGRASGPVQSRCGRWSGTAAQTAGVRGLSSGRGMCGASSRQSSPATYGMPDRKEGRPATRRASSRAPQPPYRRSPWARAGTAAGPEAVAVAGHLLLRGRAHHRRNRSSRPPRSQCRVTSSTLPRRSPGAVDDSPHRPSRRASSPPGSDRRRPRASPSSRWSPSRRRGRSAPARRSVRGVDLRNQGARHLSGIGTGARRPPVHPITRRGTPHRGEEHPSAHGKRRAGLPSVPRKSRDRNPRDLAR